MTTKKNTQIIKNQGRNNKKNRGFSLVELLAVIVVIGIISVIAIAGVSRYTDRARREKIGQNKKNVAMAAQMYVQANREKLPKLIGDASLLKVEELREKNYLKEDVTNANGETCMEKSFVRIYKLDDDEYSYTTFLYCGDDEVPEEPDVPKPVVVDFKYSGGNASGGKFNGVKDATFDFTIKGAEEDDTVGIYSYNYVIFVRGSNTEPYTEVFNSGTLKGGLETTIKVQSQPLTKYISLTSYSNVRVDITAINEQGGKLDYSKTTGEFEDKENPICGSTEGEAKDDDDWVNKVTYGANGNIPNGQLRAYPGRVSVNCSDGVGSGCKRDKFTRSWPNNSNSVSGVVNYKFGTRWGYVLLEDNAGTANATKCYVRANVDVQAPRIVLRVYRTKDKSQISTIDVHDSNTVNAVMPEGTIASDKHSHVTGTGTEKWMNLENFDKQGIYIEADITDNLYLYSYEWKVNNPYVAGGTAESVVSSTASTGNVAGEGTTVAATGTFPSNGMTDFPKNDAQLATAEHGSQQDVLRNLKITREGKRYASLKACDKAGNCTTVHIYANIDYTPPLVPKTSYEKITSRTNYVPGTVNDYKDHNHWSKEYVRPYVDGQRDDKETQNASVKVELSGWDQFIYTYKRQSGKNGNTYTWHNPIERSIKNASGSNGRFGFDITDEGTHIVTFKSCDRAGNCSANSVDDYVKVDTIKPTCDIVTKYEENGKDITSSITGATKTAIGSTNGSGWLKIGQQVTLSHSCLDEDNKFSSGCNGDDYHNKQKYLFNGDIETSKAGANGFNTTYGANDNTAGGHVVDYAGNISDECPKMTVKVDHTAPTCKTAISWPEGNPINPSTAGKLETGWLGLLNGTGPDKKTAKVAVVCTDPTSTSGLMTGIRSTCDDTSKYDPHKYNQQFHIYNTEMVLNFTAGAVGDKQGGNVIDIAGNVTPCPADRMVKIDYTKPNCGTKIDYGTGAGAGSYNKINSTPKSATGWLGWVGNTDTAKEMARVTQTCNDNSGATHSGCFGDMLFKVYDWELNVPNAGAVKVGDNGSIKDYAGNITNCNDKPMYEVKIDYTRPVCAVDTKSTGSGNGYSWAHNPYNGDWVGAGSTVTITSHCVENANAEGTRSGCNTNVSRNYTAEISTTQATTGGDGVDYWVFDKADNRAAAACPTKTVKIDLTGPVCTTESRYGKGSVGVNSTMYDATATNLSVPQYNGWLNGKYKVLVRSQCTDDKLRNGKAGSQCKETSIHNNSYGVADGQIFDNSKGAESNGNATVIYDNVGNSTTCAKKKIKLDAAKPTCTVTAQKNGSSSYGGEWTNTDFVRVSRFCTDHGSGCNQTSLQDQHYDYRVENEQFKTWNNGGAAGPGDGDSVTDNVWNTRYCKADKTIKLDKTKPTCTYSTSGVIGRWTNKNVTITGTCNDTGSGCNVSKNGNMKDTYNSDIDEDRYYRRTVYDIAGNSNSCTSGPYRIKVWKSKPKCDTHKVESSLYKEEGVKTSLHCITSTGNGTGPQLTSCGGRSCSGSAEAGNYPQAENVKSTPTYTVKDEAGNSNTCSVPVYHKYQNRSKSVSCNECSSAGCETRNSCKSCSNCGSYDCSYFAGWTYSTCAKTYHKGCYESDSVNTRWKCTCPKTCCNSCRNSSCSCADYYSNCSKCNSTPSVSGGWTDGSNKGWSTTSNSGTATFWERRTVYY